MTWTKLTPRNAWIPALALGLATFALNLFGPDMRLAARRPSLECGRPHPLKQYAHAQSMFLHNDWDGDTKLAYAHPFVLLNSQTDSNGIPLQLIDATFAQATSPSTPKHGYYFGEPKTIAGQPIDWEKDFALCATPAIYGRTGYRTFIVSSDGRVWAKDLGNSELVTDYPSDPGTEGWHEVENNSTGATRRAAPVRPAILAGIVNGCLLWLVIAFFTRKRTK